MFKINSNDVKKYVAEMIGTMVLVIFGCGVAVVSGGTNWWVATSLAFGLTIVAMAYSIGNISGCHINPAVSLAMLINKKLSVKDFVWYVIAQCIGAVIGALVLMLLFGGNDALGANQAQAMIIRDNAISTYMLALLAEIILTFVFVIAIIGVTSEQKYSSKAGIVIGLALTLVHLLGLGLTGTSVNPARSFGPAILQGGAALNQLWIFIAGPFIGSALAAFAYRFLASKKEVVSIK